MLLAVAPLGFHLKTPGSPASLRVIACTGLVVSAIVSMTEPTEQSSPAYIWLFRFGHSLFHLGTAYFAHPSLWKYFKAGPRDDRRQHREGEQ
jgi:hypothetical protein